MPKGWGDSSSSMEPFKPVELQAYVVLAEGILRLQAQDGSLHPYLG